MVISAMRKKKSSAVKHSVRKLLSGKALELQSQRSGESRPGNNTGWGTPGRQSRGAQPFRAPRESPGGRSILPWEGWYQNRPQWGKEVTVLFKDK